MRTELRRIIPSIMHTPRVMPRRTRDVLTWSATEKPSSSSETEDLLYCVRIYHRLRWYCIINRSFSTNEGHLQVGLKTEVHTAAEPECESAMLTTTHEPLNPKPDVYHTTSVQHGANKPRVVGYDTATS